MKEAAILIIMLLNQGHWLSGRDNAVSLRWLLDQPMPAATLQWEMALGDAVLARGVADIETAEKDAVRVIAAPTPAVRVRTVVTWRWRLVDRADKRIIARGEERVRLYPDQLLTGMASSAKGRRIVVLDTTEEWPTLLDKAGVAYDRIDQTSALSTLQPDVLLVGPDQIANVPFEQQPIAGVAEAGCSVFLLRQTKAASLGEYPLLAKATPRTLQWRPAHPLLSSLEPDALGSWLTDAGQADESLQIVRLTPGTAALELVFWPYEQKDTPPAAIDALLVTRSAGRGRIVYCQFSLRPWMNDPRTQLFLAGALEYLLTPAQPTLPPRERKEAFPAVELPADDIPGHPQLFRGASP